MFGELTLIDPSKLILVPSTLMETSRQVSEQVQEQVALLAAGEEVAFTVLTNIIISILTSFGWGVKIS